jgi:hypothetical protein
MGRTIPSTILGWFDEMQAVTRYAEPHASPRGAIEVAAGTA